MGAWIGLMKKRMIRRWARPGAFLRPASGVRFGHVSAAARTRAAQRIHRSFRYKNKKCISRRHAFNALDNNQLTRSRFGDSFTSQNDLTDSSSIDYSPAANRADLLLPRLRCRSAHPVASSQRFGIAIPANAFQ
ncbi:hypothetical protein [Burkholderia ambifaria]|uniref:hypothetical protein n=1 Tax=Burkholderia ambifaria TaxID=152480 RepID=UPI001C93559D|nr:hypothetical protein [Burkholderia ambifaria]MBY4767124.1 hypothetical protein [Burkholderia ambifaria]